jgi:hypothetical protein
VERRSQGIGQPPIILLGVTLFPNIQYEGKTIDLPLAQPTSEQGLATLVKEEFAINGHGALAKNVWGDRTAKVNG